MRYFGGACHRTERSMYSVARRLRMQSVAKPRRCSWRNCHLPDSDPLNRFAPMKLPYSAPIASGWLARHVARRLTEAGLDATALLTSAELPSTLLSNETITADPQATVILLDRAADVLNDKLFGFHLASDFDARQLGLVHYVVASAPTVGEALAREQRFSPLLDHGLAMTVLGESGTMVDVRPASHKLTPNRHLIEFWMTSLVLRYRALTGRPLVPSWVSFVHPLTGSLTEMQRLFATDLRFAACENRIAFDPSSASMPLVSADDVLGRILLQIEEDVLLTRTPTEPSLALRVQGMVLKRLAEGAPRICSVASGLGLSVRTLTRRLAEEGHTFTDIVDELRQHLALRYLGDRRQSVSQIALLLGYAEVSAFVRAVRRWTGASPTELRRRLTHE